MKASNSSRYTSTVRGSAGMTLVELLLVLVLLVVVASLAVPVLEGSFASVRLKRAADQVMTDFSQARTHAIESGQVYQFRFKPRGNGYRVDTWRRTMDGNDPASESTELWSLEKELPVQVTFDSGRLAERTESGQHQAISLGDSSEWSAPVFFFPDGSTSTASVLLKNQRQHFQRITLRALTGVARASDLLSEEEAERYQAR